MDPSLQVLQALVSGLLIGLALSLLGAGFGLVWGATGAINISHTAFAVAAAYLAYAFSPLGTSGLLLAVVVSPTVALGLGILMYRLIIRPAARKVRDLALVTLVATLGISVAVENSLAAIWGPGPRVLSLPTSGEALGLFGVRIPVGTFLAAILSCLGLAALWLFLYRSYTGKAVRAVWQDPIGAALYGIDRDVVTDIAFGIATAAAALAGVTMAMIYAFSPAVYVEWLIWVFLIVIVGGVGSLTGTVLAGLLVGLLSTTVGLWIPFSWVPAILFGALMGVILWRPKGIF